MTWSRYDDKFDDLEAIEDAWEAERATIGLHVMATTHCNRALSDGVVQPRWLRRKLPNKTERARVLDKMLEHRLFVLLRAGDHLHVVDQDDNELTLGPFDEDRYVVREFLRWHESSIQVKERRATDARRKRLARKKSEGSPPGRPDGLHDDVREDSGTESGVESPRARTRGSAGGHPHPDPTRPDPAEALQGSGAGLHSPFPVGGRTDVARGASAESVGGRR